MSGPALIERPKTARTTGSDASSSASDRQSLAEVLAGSAAVSSGGAVDAEMLEEIAEQTLYIESLYEERLAEIPSRS